VFETARAQINKIKLDLNFIWVTVVQYCCGDPDLDKTARSKA